MSTLDRREFLKTSVGAVATATLAASVGRASPNDVIRVGCVGIRGRGGEHISAFEKMDGVEIVALCDVDPMVLNLRAGQLDGQTGRKVKRHADLRELIDDKDIDVITTATPNHWHSLVGIWAMQAGKDVYVEKPCSHNVVEGRRLVDAARKYNRICQHGTQGRSSEAVKEAVEFMRNGGIGKVHTAKGLCYKWRPSIGSFADSPAPKGVDYNLWLGPAAERPFNKNRFHYNWHWHWDYGNGDIGNQGVHQMDVARWGLGKGLPQRVLSSGGRYGYQDAGETPNTMLTTLDYGDCQLVFEVRGLPTNDENGVQVGNIWYGSDGYLVLNGYGSWKTFMGSGNKPGPTSTKGGGDHFGNFITAVRSRKVEDLNADVEEGHLSSALCHLANISYRLGRTLSFDPNKETFVSDDEANGMLTRDYRSPFSLPTV